jgi:hypothetical protein
MPLPAIVDDITQLLRRKLARPAVADTNSDTAELLYDLLHKDIWLQEELEVINQLSRQVNITRRLYSCYDKNWNRSAESLLHEPWRSLAALHLYRIYLLDREGGVQHSILLKRFNTLLKGLELAEQDWIDPASELRRRIMSDYQELTNVLRTDSFDIDVTVPTTGKHDRTVTDTLPITVLFYEGPIARAYLETIRMAGFRPRRIIQLISSLDLADKRPVGRFLPPLLRQPYAASIQKSKIHYWPGEIAATHPELYLDIASQVEECLEFPVQVIDDACALKQLTEYCDDVEPLLVTGLKDKRLHEHLSSIPPSTILFTGGGIVPASLLGINEHRFIHVHPGYLPNIRGADCVLWSALLTGHTSATSFYMSPSIDAGDIIKPCWLPRVEFDIAIDTYDLKTLYRAIYSFFDPWVRSYVLRETIILHNDFTNISTVEQRESEGTTFHFMHPDIQRSALLLSLLRGNA